MLGPCMYSWRGSTIQGPAPYGYRAAADTVWAGGHMYGFCGRASSCGLGMACDWGRLQLGMERGSSATLLVMPACSWDVAAYDSSTQVSCRVPLHVAPLICCCVCNAIIICIMNPGRPSRQAGPGKGGGRAVAAVSETISPYNWLSIQLS